MGARCGPQRRALLLRGVGKGGLRETAKRIGARLGGHDAGVAIDPRLFRLFGVVRVPAVVVVPAACRPARAGGARSTPPRSTTSLPETSVWRRRWRLSRMREGSVAMQRGGCSRC